MSGIASGLTTKGSSRLKKKHFKPKHQKAKLFRANEPLLSVFMWGVNHTARDALSAVRSRHRPRCPQSARPQLVDTLRPVGPVGSRGERGPAVGNCRTLCARGACHDGSRSPLFPVSALRADGLHALFTRGLVTTPFRRWNNG
ncbi:hypothetical protein HPB49_017224 [Dermacentor silvarum]|uniref:Uncharacterized protein n=1 Tax=Dermacentor silvarum TaxID=543639 RepID=A0ACB8DEW2_DERSI|nr:hypothetical protein HPB49_017224 [Dermacentor silvarum]